MLGGKRSNFKDLSDGKATDFRFQHDARWHDNYSVMTIFDNGAEDGNFIGEYSRGMRIAVDQEAMTATLLNEYINPHKIYGVSQGSLQVLPNGNVLLGYGNTGAMTEFSQDGTVLCDVHFGPEALFGTGGIQSYRIFKFDWVGNPTTSPDVRILYPNETDHAELYVSWNGATEVAEWILQVADNIESSKWEIVGSIAKAGFETMFNLDQKLNGGFVRVLGVDRKGIVLGQSEAWKFEPEKVALKMITPVRLLLAPPRIPLRGLI